MAVTLLGPWAICSSGRMGCDWEDVIKEGALAVRKVADCGGGGDQDLDAIGVTSGLRSSPGCCGDCSCPWCWW